MTRTIDEENSARGRNESEQRVCWEGRIKSREPCKIDDVTRADLGGSAVHPVTGERAESGNKI
jgi:hypothetical protein